MCPSSRKAISRLSVRIVLRLAILCSTLKLRPDHGLINHGPDAFDLPAREAIEDVLGEDDASAVDGQPEQLARGRAVEEQSRADDGRIGDEEVDLEHQVRNGSDIAFEHRPIAPEAD